MTLETMINNVLPDGTVLFKDSGTFMFYKSDKDFDDGKEFSTQGCNESFTEFVERTIKEIMEAENEDDLPLVTIDFAIYNSK